jgi:hypothetical protein
MAFVLDSSLQRHNTEKWNKYSQKRKCAASVLVSTFMFLWAIYIFPGSVCPFCCRKVDRFWKYINRSQTHECGNWDWGHAILFCYYINGIFVAVLWSIPTLQIMQLSVLCSVQRPHIDGTDDMNRLFFRLSLIHVSYPLCSVFLKYCSKVKEKKLTLSTWSIYEIYFQGSTSPNRGQWAGRQLRLDERRRRARRERPRPRKRPGKSTCQPKWESQ